ncbi:MAG: DNA repair protein RecO [Acidimicrobiales bacterium]
MGLYRDRGVVLRTMRLGESDRIITLLSEGRGKVRAVAKGVRRTRSRIGGRLEPPAHVALLLWEGRELDTVTQVETIDSFRAIREDLGRLSRVTPMLEAADQVAQEQEANGALYRMLLGALRALAAGDAPVLLGAFFWKLLALDGAHPVLDRCANCSSGADLVAFDLSAGGALCRGCRQGVPASAGALALVEQILSGGLVAALRLPAGPLAREVEHLATHAIEFHLERRLRSVHTMPI